MDTKDYFNKYFEMSTILTIFFLPMDYFGLKLHCCLIFFFFKLGSHFRQLPWQNFIFLWISRPNLGTFSSDSPLSCNLIHFSSAKSSSSLKGCFFCCNYFVLGRADYAMACLEHLKKKWPGPVHDNRLF